MSALGLNPLTSGDPLVGWGLIVGTDLASGEPPGAQLVNQFIEFVQQYAPLFAVLAAVATVLGLAFTIYKTAHDRQVRALNRRIADLEKEAERLRIEGNEALRPLVVQLEKQLEEAKKDAEEMKARHASAEDAWHSREIALQGECDRCRETTEELGGQLGEAREELARRDRGDRARMNLMKRAMKLEGKVWERKVL
jgi:hypothetical protein